MPSLSSVSYVLPALRLWGWALRSTALAWVALGALAWGADWKHDVGYIQLVDVLGSTTPNGNGVPISQVEALLTITNDNGTPEDTNDDFVTTRSYKPDPNNAEFTFETDPFGQNVTFVDASNNNCGGPSEPCIGFSSHATFSVGQPFYGNTTSLAGGVNTVTLYEAGDWLNNALNLSNGQDPETQNFRVQNHSWIGNFGTDSADRDALQRFDFVIDRDNVTAVVGLSNNGSLSQGTLPNPSLAHPSLLSQSYNAIAVGRTDSYHSRGLSTISSYGPGRIKPDIVVPFTTTSQAASAVSSAATMLHEAADGKGAANNETMKAILLAGATKGEFASFVEPSTGVPNPWARTFAQPLDDLFGAGELNVYNSYLMIAGGQTAGSTDAAGLLVETVDSSGWDYQTDTPENDQFFYNFEVPLGSTAAELSIILAWNVKVTDSNTGPAFSGSESLANLDLALYNSTAGFLGTLVDESISTVDNVEHIYQTGLGPGTYTLRVSGASSRDFGLAWRLNTLFDVASADFDEDGDVDGSDFLAWQRGSGTLLGATHSQGDADGDGDVDSIDAGIFGANYGVLIPLPSLASSVPEPSALALFLVGALLLPRRRRRVTCESLGG